ncbi:unnamed protein product [Urochloa humidicola]
MNRQGAGGHGRGYNMGYGEEEEEQFFGGGAGGFQGGGFGLDPGYGDAGRSRGRGWPRSGFRPRGTRGFAPRRGGFAGRQGRGGGDGRHGRHQMGAAVGGGGAPVSLGANVNLTGSKPPIGHGSIPAANVGDTSEPAPMAGSGAAGMEWDQQIESEEKEVYKGGKKEKTCGRCTQKGHLAADCTNKVYCVICDGHDHVNHRCHLLKQPRPVAHAVGYAVMGLGFYHIPHAPLSRKKDSKTALVKVVGGTLSVEQMIVQLQRVVPGKWKWEPVAHEKGSFVVPFPSKNELQRAIAFGGADVRENGVSKGMRMQFEEWHEEEEGYLLPKVWIRVTGIRKKLREFLNLWAIGTLLGSTQMVDMETTRKNKFGRILVAVLDPKLLPSKLDVVIGDHYFELKFKIEPVGFDDNGDEVQFDFGNDDEDQDMDEDDPKEEEHLDREGKRSRNEPSDNQGGKDAAENNGTPNTTMENTNTMSTDQREEMEAKIQRMASEIIDMAVEKSLNFCADKILEEEEDERLNGMLDKDCSNDNEPAPKADLVPLGGIQAAVGVLPALKPAGLSSTSHNVLNGGPELAKGAQVLAGRLGRAHVRLDQAGALACRTAGSAPPSFRAGGLQLLDEQQWLQNGVEMSENLVATARIKEVVVSPARSSPRLAGASDQHTLERPRSVQPGETWTLKVTNFLSPPFLIILLLQRLAS